MRSWPPAPRMAPTDLRVALELDLGSETIGGRIEGPDGPLEFSGWLGLASALEQLLGSTPLKRDRAGDESRPDPRS